MALLKECWIRNSDNLNRDYLQTSKNYLDELNLSDEYIETRRPNSIDKEIKRHFAYIVKLWIKNIFTGKETSELNSIIAWWLRLRLIKESKQK